MHYSDFYAETGQPFVLRTKLDLCRFEDCKVERTTKELKKVHFKQLRTYLKLLNRPEGWLINFGAEDFVKGMVKIKNYDFHQ